jgi:hypothetical protein
LVAFHFLILLVNFWTGLTYQDLNLNERNQADFAGVARDMWLFTESNDVLAYFDIP